MSALFNFLKNCFDFVSETEMKIIISWLNSIKATAVDTVLSKFERLALEFSTPFLTGSTNSSKLILEHNILLNLTRWKILIKRKLLKMKFQILNL